MADWTVPSAPLREASGDVVVVAARAASPELHPASTSTSGTRASVHPACRRFVVTRRSTAGNLGAPVP